MAFNINQFNADIASKGVSKESDFEVKIYFPQSLGGLDSDLTLRAEQAVIPGRSAQSIDDARDVVGPPRKIGYTAIYLPVTITFLCDEELRIKEKMEKWMDIITGNHRVAPRSLFTGTTPFNPGYYSDYIGTIEIVKMNQTGTRAITTRLLEAYPLSIALLNLSWESSSLHKLQVEFQYRYYEQLETKSRLIDEPNFSSIVGLPNNF